MKNPTLEIDQKIELHIESYDYVTGAKVEHCIQITYGIISKIHIEDKIFCSDHEGLILYRQIKYSMTVIRKETQRITTFYDRFQSESTNEIQAENFAFTTEHFDEIDCVGDFYYVPVDSFKFEHEQS